MTSDPSLTPFFNPQGVALVGISRDPTKLGYGLARNLVVSGYTGAIHFVNPKGDQPAGPADLCLAWPRCPTRSTWRCCWCRRQFAPGVLEECGARGIRAVILASGGFRETGRAGAALEAAVPRRGPPPCDPLYWAELHRPGQHPPAASIPPSCSRPRPRPATWPLSPTPARSAPRSSIGSAGEGFGLSHLASLGNQADVNETDMLAPVAADPYTKVITLYLEGISDGRRFTAEARQVSRSKPILALKVGRFASGQRAAASHTGALAGAEAAFDAAFERAGVIRAATMQEMFQWARALAWCPLPRGRRVAVLTNAGGPGVACSDALELNGLQLADLSEATAAGLKALLPPAASLHNPVDMLASAMPEHYAGCLRLLLDDPGVDSVIVISPPPPASSAGAVAKAILPLIQGTSKTGHARSGWATKLIQEAVEFSRAVQIAEYRFPEEAASALGVLVRRAESLAAAEGRTHGAGRP